MESKKDAVAGTRSRVIMINESHLEFIQSNLGAPLATLIQKNIEFIKCRLLAAS